MLKTKTIAALLGFTPQGVRKWIKEDRLIIQLINLYFDENDIADFIEKGKIKKMEQIQYIDLVMSVETKVFEKLKVLYKRIEFSSNIDIDEVEGINAKANALIQLILETVASPVYTNLKASFFSPEFKSSLETILSYDWKDLDLTNDECDAETSYQHKELIEFVFSFDEIALIYLEKFTSHIKERWDDFIQNEKRKFQDYKSEQEQLCLENSLIDQGIYENMSDEENNLD